MSRYKVSPFVHKIIQEIEHYRQINEGNEWQFEDLMIAFLQTNPEFSRSKYQPLKKGVKEAISILTNEKQQDDQMEDVSEKENEPSIQETRSSVSLNSILTQSYSQIPSNNSEESTAKKRELYDKKPSKKQKSTYLVEKSNVRYEDFGGIEGPLAAIKELIERPFLMPHVYTHLGVDIPRGILLFGPPGCGKTSLAMAIANELNAPLLKVSAPEIVSGMSGESEAKIRDLFEQAKKLAPCIVFIDEIDAITPKRETAQREMERRIVAQLLTSLDDVSLEHTQNLPVIVIGATNRPDSIDPALRRAGRFDREIQLGIPNEEARKKILQVFSRKLRLRGEFNFTQIARQTPGYVGADLKALIREAATLSINRLLATENLPPLENRSSDSLIPPAITEIPPHILEEMYIEESDFLNAIPKVQPSAKREGFAVVPDTTWDDIGALDSVRSELQMTIVAPLKYPELYEAVGINSPAGLLLWGPPGCGKTLLAKAIANESHSNFISIKGPELLNKYVGESERSVRQVFERARSSAPCVVFFDELDALCPKRNDDANVHSSRVVNQLLTEMDGLNERKNVFIIAASNRPDIIDPAMLRPGRLDKLIYVDLPNPQERTEILQAISRKSPLSSDVNLTAIANDPRCDGFSGADLSALLREAALASLRDQFSSLQTIGTNNHVQITMEHFNRAFSRTFPSVSKHERASYERRRAELSSHNLH